MVKDIVRQVAGDEVEVIGLLGEGVDPHLYRPTRSDIKQIMAADVVFYSGLLLEGKMTEVFEKAEGNGKPVFAVTAGIDPSYLRQPPEFEGHFDPHVWMDVAAWKECVEYVADELCRFRPTEADNYRRNATAYGEQLAALDDYVRTVIATIPEEQRVLVTAHDAFGYFSRAYDIPVRSVQGISTESQAGVKHVNELVDFLVARKVGAIFIESSVSAQNIQAIIEGAKSKGWDVRIGGELFSDAMGAPETYEGTYIGMLDHNATTIAHALGGEAPERGFQGKLTSARR